MAINNPINVSIVGHGYWGSKIADRVNKNRRMRLASVVDDNPVDMIPGVPTVSFEDMISDHNINLVGVFTPPSTHYDIIKLIIENGKNVLTTKPFVLEPWQAEKLLDLAKENSVKIFIDYTYLYSPVIRKVKELLDFTPVYIDYANANRWTGGNDPGVSVIQDLAPHPISILLYLFPGVETKILGVNKISVASENDMVYTDIMIGPIYVSMTMGWAYPNKERRNVIVGRNKMITFDTSAVVVVQETHSEGAKIITDVRNEITIGGEPLQIELEEIVDVLDGGDFNTYPERFPIEVTKLTKEIDDE